MTKTIISKIGAYIIGISLFLPVLLISLWASPIDRPYQILFWYFGLATIAEHFTHIPRKENILFLPNIPGILLTILIIYAIKETYKVTTAIDEKRMKGADGAKRLLMWAVLALISPIIWIIIHPLVLQLLFPLYFAIYGPKILLFYGYQMYGIKTSVFIGFYITILGACIAIFGALIVYITKED